LFGIWSLAFGVCAAAPAAAPGFPPGIFAARPALPWPLFGQNRAMKSVLEFCLIGLCVVTVTLLACWGWWEVRHWWQLRGRASSGEPWEDDKN
jgi:hypothetical protein